MRAYVLLVLLLADFGQPLSPQESIIDVAYSDVVSRCPTQLHFNLLCCPLSPFQPTLDGVGANIALILLFVMGALAIPLAAVERKCSPYCRAAIDVAYHSVASFPPLLKKGLSLLLILYAARVVGMLLIMSGDVEQNPGPTNLDPQSHHMFEEAMKEGSIDAKITKCLFIDTAGSGKTNTICLLFGWPAPDEWRSTDCIKRSIRAVKVGETFKEVDSKELLSLLAGDISTPKDSSANASEVTGEDSSTTNPSRPPTETGVDIARKISEGLADGKKLRDVEWVHLIDSGGQSQFHQVLSAFLKDVSAGVFVINLSEELSKPPLMDKGTKCGDCASPLTNEENLRSCIQTVQSLLYTTSQTLPEVLDEATGEALAGATVEMSETSRKEGTHQDKLETHLDIPETIEEKNNNLLKILRPTKGSENTSFHDNLVYTDNSMSEVIFAINATSRDEYGIAKKVCSEIVKIKPSVKQIPLHWYVLELEIESFAKKQGRMIVTFEECRKIGEKLCFPSREHVKAALVHLDRLNIFLYYPEVLPDLVFTDPSVLMDKVRELVQKSYLLRYNPSDKPMQGKWLHFCNEGIITYDMLEEFPSHTRDREYLSSQQLVWLFEHLLIVAPISVTEFFMPALLDQLRPEEIVRPTSEHASAYVISFPNGYAPCGLFSALVACLRSSWKFAVSDQLYGNKITFNFPTYPAEVMLLDFGSFFEVHVDIKAESSSLCSSLYETVCPLVRQTINDGLEQACTARNFKNVTRNEAILCKKPSHTHPATIEINTHPYLWKCTCDHSGGELESKELVWFPAEPSLLSTGQLRVVSDGSDLQPESTVPTEEPGQLRVVPDGSDPQPESTVPTEEPGQDSTETPGQLRVVPDGSDPQPESTVPTEEPGQDSTETPENPKYTEADLLLIVKSKNPHSKPNRGTKLYEALEKFANKVVIIIQTVNENEFRAALDSMRPPESDDGHPLPDLTTCVTFPHAASYVGMFGGYKAALVPTGMGEKCREDIEDALGSFPRAKAVIAVGVAYAMSCEKCKFGDVLVSQSITDLSAVKFEDDGRFTEPVRTKDVWKNLKRIFCTNTRNFAIEKDFKCTEKGRYPQIILGTIVSMSWLVDNKETKEEILKNSPEAVGGEMEGYVLTQIQKKLAEQEQPCQLGVIVIKGVADYADGEENKEWQFTAAMAAVGYAHHQLEMNPGEFETDYDGELEDETTFLSTAFVKFREYFGCLKYYVQVYYQDVGLKNTWQVDVLITSNLELCKQVVQEKYAEVSDTHINVYFDDRIELDIPRDGIVVESGWRITPMNNQWVTKDEVLSIQQGQKLPTCQLRVEWVKNCDPPANSPPHTIQLKYTKDERDNFKIPLPPVAPAKPKRELKDNSGKSNSGAGGRNTCSWKKFGILAIVIALLAVVLPFAKERFGFEIPGLEKLLSDGVKTMLNALLGL